LRRFEAISDVQKRKKKSIEYIRGGGIMIKGLKKINEPK